MELAWRDSVRVASAFCTALPTPPEDLAELEAYFKANAPLLTAVLRSANHATTVPLFTPKTNQQTGEINWDSVDSLTSRYHRTDVQVRSTPTAEDWRSLYSVLVIWRGDGIEVRGCATQHLERCLDDVRAAVRTARKGAPPA